MIEGWRHGINQQFSQLHGDELKLLYAGIIGFPLLGSITADWVGLVPLKGGE